MYRWQSSCLLGVSSIEIHLLLRILCHWYNQLDLIRKPQTTLHAGPQCHPAFLWIMLSIPYKLLYTCKKCSSAKHSINLLSPMQIVVEWHPNVVPNDSSAPSLNLPEQPYLPLDAAVWSFWFPLQNICTIRKTFNSWPFSPLPCFLLLSTSCTACGEPYYSQIVIYILRKVRNRRFLNAL